MKNAVDDRLRWMPRAFACIVIGTAYPANAGTAVLALWQPAGITASTDSLDTVLAKLRTSAADAGRPAEGRHDRFEIDGSGEKVDADVTVRGDAYVIRMPVPNGTLAMGRSAGERWRQNASGTVHRIRADVQSNALDRWPVAELGFDASDCTLAGVATLPAPSWVIADRPALDLPRFLYVDMTTGDIVREVSREGSHIVTYDFSDVRGAAGARRAERWSIAGWGGSADVTLLDTSAATVAESDVATPAQGPPIFTIPTAAQRLDTSFTSSAEFIVKARVNGNDRHMLLDTGTTQLIFGRDMSQAYGPLAAGNGSVREIEVGGQIARDAAFLDAGYGFREGGILGYDFFRGRIVHVDYGAERLDVLPREGFVPPPDARALPTDWSEGLPIVTARVGLETGSRFALDTGSPHLVVSQAFVTRAENDLALGIDPAPYDVNYLEGLFMGNVATAHHLTLGNVDITESAAIVERADPNSLAIPLDGIIGTDQLTHFEWWFDADGPTSWFRFHS